ncbi:TIR domain-containing protein [Nocardioides sp.]|uniref:TIR domain-containing protein n=1 Tax=Nocardioides sp. TaxID=35761 RepID=UPI002C94CD40|nr:TIR domain-containing protein [Nocardioides sp.]HSX65918.1 TIR domain-containing protein [Nocardioides sp.]
MRFFISYNTQDSRWAEWLAWQLEDLGHTAIVQAWDFAPGSNFVLEMDRALGGADVTLAVLSPAFLSSAFAAAEWAAAFATDPTAIKRNLVPVRVGECDPPGLLGQLVYLDLVDLDESEARRRVEAWIETLTIGRAKPISQPPFPPSHSSNTAASSDRSELKLDLEWYADRSSIRHFELAELLGLTAPMTKEQICARWTSSDGLPLQVLLGRGRLGERVVLDLQWDGPCGYVLGSSGTGTSTLLKSIALGLAATYSPARVQFCLVGRKDGSVFRDYAGLPHERFHFDHENWSIESLAEALAGESSRRMQTFREANVTDFGQYNEQKRSAQQQPLPFLMTLVDECWDRELLELLASYQSRGRALGMGLIVAVQSASRLTASFVALARFAVVQGHIHASDVPMLNDAGGTLRELAAASSALRWAPGRGALIRSAAHLEVFQAPHVEWIRGSIDSPYLTSPEIESILDGIRRAGQTSDS